MTLDKQTHVHVFQPWYPGHLIFIIIIVLMFLFVVYTKVKQGRPCSIKIPTALLLKAVDTIGNYQRLAFTVGVSQHMHKITNL